MYTYIYNINICISTNIDVPTQGFKFNFGVGGDDESAGEESKSFNFDDYRTTPEGNVKAREMPADYDKEEEMDEMAIEALFEDVVFENGSCMFLCVCVCVPRLKRLMHMCVYVMFARLWHMSMGLLMVPVYACICMCICMCLYA